MSQVEVKGSSASYDPRRDDTATRIVIGRDEMSRYDDRSVVDVLKRVPGITIDTNQGRSSEIRMRGMGGGYTQILIDGQRPASGFSLESLSPDTIERIEVLRAATADLSTQSVAGTVNIILRHVAKKAERSVKLGMLESSASRGPSATLNLSDRREDFAYTLAATVQPERHTRHFSIVEENTAPGGVVDLLRTTAVPERGRTNSVNLAPRLEWTLAGGDKLGWSTLYNARRARNTVRQRVTTLLGPPPPVPELDVGVRGDTDSLRSDLSWTRGLASGATLEAKLGVEGEDIGQVQQRYGRDAGAVPVTDGRIEAASRERGVSSTGKYMRQLAGGHALAFGWDAGVKRREDSRDERDAIRVFPPGLALDERFDARITRLALYGQDEWQLAPQWSMYLGARWEGIRIRVSGDGIEEVRNTSSVFSPILQALWKNPRRKGDQVRLALTRTYKAPGLRNLTPRRETWENNSATEADPQGNPDLKPELAWGIDAAYEHHWADKAMVSLAASVRRISDYTSNRVRFDGYRWIYTPVNAGRAENRSLELDTKFPLRTLFGDAPAIDVRAGVSRHWARVDEVPGPDNRFERQSPLSANLGLDWRAGALSAGGSASYVRNGRVQVTANRTYYADARTDLEAYVAYRLAAQRQVRLSLSNLLRDSAVGELTYADPVSGMERRRFDFPSPLRIQATYETGF